MVDRCAVPPARYLCYLKESPGRRGYGASGGQPRVAAGGCPLQRAPCSAPELRLAARHNLGFDRPWRWDDYFNLGESRLCDASDERPLPLVRSLPPGRLETLVLAPRAHLGAGAPAELVVRRIRSNSYFHDVPLRWLARLGGGWRGLLPGMPPLVLRLAPSQRVRALARPILDELQARRAGFAAVHVRRGDRLRGLVAYWTAPERIAPAPPRAGRSDRHDGVLSFRRTRSGILACAGTNLRRRAQRVVSGVRGRVAVRAGRSGQLPALRGGKSCRSRRDGPHRDLSARREGRTHTCSGLGLGGVAPAGEGAALDAAGFARSRRRARLGRCPFVCAGAEPRAEARGQPRGLHSPGAGRRDFRGGCAAGEADRMSSSVDGAGRHDAPGKTVPPYEAGRTRARSVAAPCASRGRHGSPLPSWT